MFIIHRLPDNILDSTIGNIRHRNNIVTGVVATDNGNGTYDVYIAGADVPYPNVPTTLPEPDFSVDDPVEIAIEYGNKEMPIIIGNAKKIVQEFVEDEVNVLVTTVGSHTIAQTSAYLDGRIEEIDGYENCTKRGFYYGMTTDYGLEKSSTGSFVAGSYSLQSTGLTAGETYHFQAFVNDVDGDEHTGEDKTVTTSQISYSFYETQLINDNNWMNAYGTRWLAYFFQAESNHTVTKIYLYMTRTGYPDTVTVSLFPNEGTGNFKPVIGGGALTSGITNGNTLLTSIGEWREFDVTPYSLISGTWYSIVIKATGGDVSNYAKWWGTNENVRPLQWRHSSDDEGVNWGSGAFDLTYKIYGY